MAKNKRKRNTYRSYLLKSFLNKFKKDKNRDNKQNDQYRNINQAEMHIALTIDGIVEDIIHCNERLGYLLLSSPEAIDFSLEDQVSVGDLYDKKSNKFKKIVEEE